MRFPTNSTLLGLMISVVFLVWNRPVYSGRIDDARVIVFDDRKSPEQTVYVTLLGDFGGKREQLESLPPEGKQDLEELMRYLDAKSVVVANLEFVYPEELAYTLAFFSSVGVDAVGIANNHAGDHPITVRQRIIAGLEEQYDIQVFGRHEAPIFDIREKGQYLRILAAAGNFDQPTEGIVSIYDESFPELFSGFLTEGDGQIFYAHLGGISKFVDFYDREKSAEFLQAGCELVLFHGPHWTKTYFQEVDGISVIAPGDFFFPTSPRGIAGPDEPAGLLQTVIPVGGFEAGKIVYLELLVIEGTSSSFKLANPEEKTEMLARIEKNRIVTDHDIYQSEEAANTVSSGFRKAMRLENLRKIRWHHVRYLFKYLYFNHRWKIGSFLVFILVVFYFRRRRKARKIQEVEGRV